MDALQAYLEKLRTQFPGRKFPTFDSNDGGCEARPLIVLQDPKVDWDHPRGPIYIEKVSRDNGDPTAKNIKKYFDGIPRKLQIMWNATPFFLNKKETLSWMDRQKCNEAMLDLIALLKNLEVVLFCSIPAQEVASAIEGRKPANVEFIKTYHPGGQGLAGKPHQRPHFLKTVEELTQRFQSGGSGGGDRSPVGKGIRTRFRAGTGGSENLPPSDISPPSQPRA